MENINVEIECDDFLAILGPDGGGKSTMMKILTCYIPPTEGPATVCGFDTNNQSIEVRKQINDCFLVRK